MQDSAVVYAQTDLISTSFCALIEIPNPDTRKKESVMESKTQFHSCIQQFTNTLSTAVHS